MIRQQEEVGRARPGSAIAEEARLQRLRSYRIVETEREPLFDELLSDVARLTAAPVAVLGFLEKDREWVKASVGWSITSLPGPFSLAAILVVAIAGFKWRAGFLGGWDWPFSVLAILSAIFILGAGAWSVDALVHLPI